MKKLISIYLMLFFSYAAFAQLEKDFFPLNREYSQVGFIISPELNYQFPLPSSAESIQINDTTKYSYTLEGEGKIGFGGEIGFFYAFKRALPFHFAEFTAGYRKLASTTDHNGNLETQSSGGLFNQVNISSNEADLQFVYASLRGTHVKQLKRYSMLMNSLGVNFNYNLNESYSYTNEYPVEVKENFPSNPTLQLHYQIGFAYRVSREVIIAPSLETTLLTAYKFDGLNTGFEYFNLKYQPIYFKLRFFILQKDPENCNAPVFNGPSPTGI